MSAKTFRERVEALPRYGQDLDFEDYPKGSPYPKPNGRWLDRDAVLALLDSAPASPGGVPESTSELAEGVTVDGVAKAWRCACGELITHGVTGHEHCAASPGGVERGMLDVDIIAAAIWPRSWPMMADDEKERERKAIQRVLAVLPRASRVGGGGPKETLHVTPNAEGWRVCVGCADTVACEAKGCQFPASATVALRSPAIPAPSPEVTPTEKPE